MKRRFRLRSSTDFRRVRQIGKSYAHPLVVLVVKPVPGELKIGITAGKSVGTAVDRNRAKRRLREAIKLWIPSIQKAWKIILIARQPISSADWDEVQEAVHYLLEKARVFSYPEATEK